MTSSGLDGDHLYSQAFGVMWSTKPPFCQAHTGTAAADERTFILWHNRGIPELRQTREAAVCSTFENCDKKKKKPQKTIKIEQIIFIYNLFSTVTSIIKIVATLFFFFIIILPSIFVVDTTVIECRSLQGRDWNCLYDDAEAFRRRFSGL